MADNRFSKSDLIAMVVEETELSKKDVKVVVDSLFEKIEDTIADGGVVTIQGFGRFFVKEAKARSFKKIHSDEVIEVGERHFQRPSSQRPL
jgi:DNA-binding protein HU-beta